MKQPSHSEIRKPGRPLSFDRDGALRQAMLTFWQHGYETTSITDLTAAMKVSAPSLYGTFGDKRRLFLEAVQLYAGDEAVMEQTIVAAASSYQAASDMLTAAAIAYTGEDTPRGCLLASATASGSADSADIQRAIARIRNRILAMLRSRIERDIADGVLPPLTSAAGFSGLIMAVTQGMSVLARDGAPRSSLLAIVETTLRAWPGGSASA